MYPAAPKRIGGSFRDPSGHVFRSDGAIYRQVNLSYQAEYELLKASGLYEHLVKRQLLIPHVEVPPAPSGSRDIYKILQPQEIPFISYPYEWSFSQLKDAALATLEIHTGALAHGMILKDASAFNIQYCGGKPMLIDTLSFETYQEGQPWAAYKQFCEHFLAPLALMSKRDIRLSQLSRVYIDGIPLSLAASLLPKRSYLRIGIAMHLHLHARAQRTYAGASTAPQAAGKNRLTKKSLLNIADSLKSAVEGLRWDRGHTAWSNYYEGDSYQDEGFADKIETVTQFIAQAEPNCVWDLGANTGAFSRIASQRQILTISMDSDPGAVETNYLGAKQAGDRFLHPLLIDLTNPSAAIGWANEERDSLAARCEADCILALALLHHLAIANNLPLPRIADYLASLADWLIVEFVPKTDKKVQTLLWSRQDIFPQYTRGGFESAFGQRYKIICSKRIKASDRIVYLMRRQQRET